MAKVSVEFDTMEKTCKVMVNGVEMEDCKSISFGQYEDEWGMSLMCKSEDESTDLTTYTHVTASDSDEAKSLKTQAYVEKNGIIFVQDNKERIRKAAYQLFSNAILK